MCATLFTYRLRRTNGGDHRCRGQKPHYQEAADPRLRCIALFGCGFCILRILDSITSILQHGIAFRTKRGSKNFSLPSTDDDHQSSCPIIYKRRSFTSIGYSKILQQVPTLSRKRTFEFTSSLPSDQQSHLSTQMASSDLQALDSSIGL